MDDDTMEKEVGDFRRRFTFIRACVASTATKDDFSLLNNARVVLTVNDAPELARFSLPDGLRFGLFSSKSNTITVLDSTRNDNVLCLWKPLKICTVEKDKNSFEIEPN